MNLLQIQRHLRLDSSMGRNLECLCPDYAQPKNYFYQAQAVTSTNVLIHQALMTSLLSEPMLRVNSYRQGLSMRHIHATALACVACMLSCTANGFAEEAANSPESLDYQERLLLYPTPKQLATEEDGRVHIYDSMEIGLVNEAMDQHFNRIENMMFIRIHHLPPAGAGPAEVENDGCD